MYIIIITVIIIITSSRYVGCKYCDLYVCLLFVCLSVCLSARMFLKPHVQISSSFLYVRYGRDSVLLRRQCNTLILPVLWMTSRFHEGNRPESKTTRTFRTVRQVLAAKAKSAILLLLFFIILSTILVNRWPDRMDICEGKVKGAKQNEHLLTGRGGEPKYHKTGTVSRGRMHTIIVCGWANWFGCFNRVYCSNNCTSEVLCLSPKHGRPSSRGIERMNLSSERVANDKR